MSPLHKDTDDNPANTNTCMTYGEEEQKAVFDVN